MSKMTVGQLKEILEGFEDDTEIRLMIQENYPLESMIAGVTTDDEIAVAEAEENGEEREHTNEPKVLYILEGRQIGYGKKIAWETAQRW